MKPIHATCFLVPLMLLSKAQADDNSWVTPTQMICSATIAPAQGPMIEPAEISVPLTADGPGGNNAIYSATYSQDFSISATERVSVKAHGHYYGALSDINLPTIDMTMSDSLSNLTVYANGLPATAPKAGMPSPGVLSWPRRLSFTVGNGTEVGLNCSLSGPQTASQQPSLLKCTPPASSMLPVVALYMSHGGPTPGGVMPAGLGLQLGGQSFDGIPNTVTVDPAAGTLSYHYHPAPHSIFPSIDIEVTPDASSINIDPSPIYMGQGPQTSYQCTISKQ